MDIYIFRDGKEIGPFSEEATRTLLQQGSIVTGDFAWSPGMPEWEPLSDVLAPVQTAPDSAPPAAEEKPAPAPEEKPVAEPVTAKQKAFFSFMGIAFGPELTKDQASRLVNDAMEDPKNADRLRQWNDDRLRLHPDLFAAEIQSKKENRAARFFEICQTEGAEYFTKITKAHCQVLVGFLDVKFPNWDAREAEAAWNYFYPAIAEKFPQLVRKQWRGKFHYAEGQKVAAEITRKAPTAKLKKPAASPLAAIVRGVVIGALILGVLYLVRQTMQENAAKTLPEKTAEPTAPATNPAPPPKPAEPVVKATPAAADSAPEVLPATTEPAVPVPPPPATLPMPANMNASPAPAAPAPATPPPQ